MSQTGHVHAIWDNKESIEKKLLRVIRGAHDMLRESAKQHRSRGDGDGHGTMCDAHADAIAELIHIDT